MCDSELPFVRVRLEAEPLRLFVENVLVAEGVDPEVSALTARGLWMTSLRGTDSHGVRLLPHYVAGVRGGRINPKPAMTVERRAASLAVVDADHGFGHAAGIRAMREAIEIAKETGAGFVSVRNSNHCGGLAYFGLEAANAGMIGIAATHATPKVRSPQSTRSLVGINPLCVAAPMEGEEPFCLDMAPTPFSNNKVKQYAEDGRVLPPGVAADSEGNETMDPHVATMLLPIGDYKGFGLAMMIDVFCSLLSGMPAADKVSAMYGNSLSEKRFLGQFYGAIRIDAFQDPEVFKHRLREIAEGQRALPERMPGVPNRMPGDPEKDAQRDRLAHGIPVTEGDYARFLELAEACNVTPPPSHSHS